MEGYVIWMRSASGGYAYMGLGGERIHAQGKVPPMFIFSSELQAKRSLENTKETLKYRAPETFHGGYEYMTGLIERVNEAVVVRIIQ